MIWWENGMGWGGWVAMAVSMLAFWSLVVMAVVVIFRDDGGGRRSERRAPDPDPLQILDERFARGDIDAEEYTARRGALLAVR